MTKAIDLLLLVYDLPKVQAKKQPTDSQWNLQQKKEKEVTTYQKPSQFKIIDRILEKSRL